jgi:hypothetical protein
VASQLFRGWAASAGQGWAVSGLSLSASSFSDAAASCADLRTMFSARHTPSKQTTTKQVAPCQQQDRIRAGQLQRKNSNLQQSDTAVQSARNPPEGTGCIHARCTDIRQHAESEVKPLGSTTAQSRADDHGGKACLALHTQHNNCIVPDVQRAGGRCVRPHEQAATGESPGNDARDCQEARGMDLSEPCCTANEICVNASSFTAQQQVPPLQASQECRKSFDCRFQSMLPGDNRRQMNAFGEPQHSAAVLATHSVRFDSAQAHAPLPDAGDMPQIADSLGVRDNTGDDGMVQNIGLDSASVDRVMEQEYRDADARDYCVLGACSAAGGEQQAGRAAVVRHESVNVIEGHVQGCNVPGSAQQAECTIDLEPSVICVDTSDAAVCSELKENDVCALRTSKTVTQSVQKHADESTAHREWISSSANEFVPEHVSAVDLAALPADIRSEIYLAQGKGARRGRQSDLLAPRKKAHKQLPAGRSSGCSTAQQQHPQKGIKCFFVRSGNKS